MKTPAEMIAAAKAVTGTIRRIHVEPFNLEMPFLDAAARFADRPGTVLLMSGGDLDCARYHILATCPWLSVSGRWGGDMTIMADDRVFQQPADPFDLLRHLLRAYEIQAPDLPAPVAAGLFGYLAYDLKDAIETLPRTSVDDLELPHMCLYAPSAILVRDRFSGETSLCIPVRQTGGKDRLDAARRAFLDILATRKIPAEDGFTGGTDGFTSPFTRPAYMEAVEKIKEYIVSGHIYQVNLSQRFETDFAGNPFSLFKTLFTSAPAPFYAYIHAGDHHIVSTSPERFLMRRGNVVESRPIKGTRPRGKTADQDVAMRRELEESPKDDAELSMIVDLMRNDIGRVCTGGSVAVAEHKRLEPYQNVFHLVSVVRGALKSGADAVDLIKATFPGGSITGCPRVRAMEIIDELEPCRRHIYTGSIGYIGFHDTLDLSIAIRTATIIEDRMVFSVGGGVVFDSDPADEYEETLHKGRSIMGVFAGRPSAVRPHETQVWYNGSLAPAGTARIPVLDKGVQYGFGFFETLCAQNGRIGYLAEHLDRFGQTWDALFECSRPDLTWEDIIDQVLAANGLQDKIAAVKIMATFGDREPPPFRPGLVVTAAPYTHRLDSLGKPGLDVVIYPHPRQTPLADHKTMNYLYYFLAGRWAHRFGADEAVILNPDGSVSETHTANLLLIEGNGVVRPASAHVLPGVMEKQVLAWLADHGYGIKHQRISPEHLSGADAVILTNSLMGAVAVLSVEGRSVNDGARLCAQIRRDVL